MSQDGNIQFGVGADVSPAIKDVQSLKTALEGIIANLTHASRTSTQQIATVTKSLDDQIKSVRKEIQHLSTDLDANAKKISALNNMATRLQSQRQRVEANTIASIGKGQFTGPNSGNIGSVFQRDNVVKGAIADINTQMDQMVGRIASAYLEAVKRTIRTSEAAIVAQASRTQRQVEQMIRAETNPAYISARSITDRIADRRINNPMYQQSRDILAQRRDQESVRRAGMSDVQYGWQRRMETISNNGGADLIGVQARVLVGYQALNMAFQAAKGFGAFVVGLDKEFRQFQAITMTTNSEMEGVRKKLIEVSEATKFTALEVAQAATIMGQAGFSARQVGDSIGAVTLLATAAGTELAPAVDLVTSTMTVFNLQASEAANIANTMTGAINGSKLTIDKLTLGMQYSGNIAAQMGITYQELTGTLGALANAGIRSGSTMGTGLRQLLIDIQTPSKDFIETLDKLNLTQQDVDIRSRGLTTVIKTLAEAGFGAADAFNSFEVRAASTFTALANNIDVATQLEKQFILSSAAVEANAIQMESLANSYARFQSVAGTVAYNTLEPFLAVMKSTIDFASAFGTELNKLPNALAVVSVAVAGLGTAMALLTGRGLALGLARGLPIFDKITLAMRTNAMAAGAAAAQGSALSRVMGVLFTAARAHPLIAFGTAAATIATAFVAMSDKGRNVTRTLDGMKGAIDTINGEIDETRSNMTAVDQAITNLIERRDELNKNPLLREVRILELIEQFSELGGMIDTSTASVEDLVDALNQIKEVDLGNQIENLAQSLAANTVLIEELKNLKVSELSEDYDEINEMLRFAAKGSDGNFLARLLGAGRGTPVQDMFAPAGSAANTLVALNAGQIARPQTEAELIEMRAVVAEVSDEARKLGLEVQQLTNLRNQRRLTNAEETRLEIATDGQRLLNLLVQASGPILQRGFEQVAAETEVKRQTSERRILEGRQIAGRTSLGGALTDMQMEQESALQQARREVEQAQSLERRAELANRLQDGFDAAMRDLDAATLEAEREMEKAGFTDGEIRDVIAVMRDSGQLGQLTNSISDFVTQQTTRLAEEVAAAAEDTSRRLAQKSGAAAKALSDAKTPAELDRAFRRAEGLSMQAFGAERSRLTAARDTAFDQGDFEAANESERALRTLEEDYQIGRAALKTSYREMVTKLREEQEGVEALSREFNTDQVVANLEARIEAETDRIDEAESVEELTAIYEAIRDLMLERNNVIIAGLQEAVTAAANNQDGGVAFRAAQRTLQAFRAEADREMAAFNAGLSGDTNRVNKDIQDKIKKAFDNRIKRMESWVDVVETRLDTASANLDQATTDEGAEAAYEEALGLHEQLVKLTEEVFAEMLKMPGMSEDELQAIQADLEASRLRLEADRRKLMEDRVDAAQRIKDEQDRRARVALNILKLNNRREEVKSDQQITQLVRRQAKSTSKAEVDMIRDELLRLLDVKDKLARAVFDEELRLSEGNPEARAEVLAQIAEYEAQYKEQVNGYIQTAIDQRNAIDRVILENTNIVIDQQIDAMQREMDKVLDEIANLKGPEGMAALVEKFEQLRTGIATLNQQAAINTFNSEALAAGLPPTGDEQVDALRWFMSQGLSQVQAAGVVGNLVVESGANLDPRAAGDMQNGSPTSFGVAQWHNERWQALVNWAASKGLDPWQRTTQYAFYMAELNGSERRAGNMLRAATTPEQANLAGLAFERPSGYEKSPQAVPSYSTRLGHTTRLATINLGIETTRQNDEALVEAQRGQARAEADDSIADALEAQDRDIQAQLIRARTLTKSTEIVEAASRISDSFAALMDAEVAAYTKANEDLIAKGDRGALQGIEDLKEKIGQSRVEAMSELMRQWDAAVEEESRSALADARARLSEAQKPANAGKFSAQDIRGMEAVVAREEQALLAAEVASAEQRLTLIRNQLADATARSGENSEEALAWLKLEAEANKELEDAIKARTIAENASAAPQMGRQEAYSSARDDWMLNSGFYKVGENGMPEMKSQAEQMEETWGGVFDALNAGFSSFYADISSGNVSIIDSFKGLGLAVVEQFQQMIIKALAFQAVQAMIGAPGDAEGSAGAGILKQIATTLFSVPKAANGEIVGGGIPGRDSVLRKVMPGEVILRQSAVQAIGVNKLRALNNLGNRTISQSEGMMTSQQQAGGGGMVNVYVVSPDNVPTMGPNDVVAVISDNISRKGTIRQLIKSVQMGAA